MRISGFFAVQRGEIIREWEEDRLKSFSADFQTSSGFPKSRKQ